jgi:ADP-heptose:LPS heptosyltransferase
MKLKRDVVKKIGVFRALQLGDMLCSIPAIRSLSSAYPNAEIVLIGLPWAATFAKRFGKYFDRFVHFPGYPGLPEQEVNIKVLHDFVAEMRNERFDLLLQMQGNGTIVNPLMMELGAVHVSGFYNKDSFVDNGLFMPYPSDKHEILRHLELMEYLEIPMLDDQLEFPVSFQDDLDFRKLPVPHSPFVVIHPGSRGRWRQWPPEYFALAGDRCAEAGYSIVVTGSQDEKDITSDVIRRMSAVPVDLTGATTLGSLGILLSKAELLVSNCTGVSHMAAATLTPSVVVSMDGEPERWGPLNKQLHTTIDCSSDLNVDIVIKEVERKIGTDHIYKHVQSHTHSL